MSRRRDLLLATTSTFSSSAHTLALSPEVSTDLIGNGKR